MPGRTGHNVKGSLLSGTEVCYAQGNLSLFAKNLSGSQNIPPYLFLSQVLAPPLRLDSARTVTEKIIIKILYSALYLAFSYKKVL